MAQTKGEALILKRDLSSVGRSVSLSTEKTVSLTILPLTDLSPS